jgi:hypothetical protein
MKNSEIAAVLREIADLLELQEVPFKPRAYRQAAQSIDRLSEQVEDFTKHRDLDAIPGIGEGIAKKIQELVKTGHLKYLDELRKETHQKVVVAKSQGKEVEFEINGVKVKARLTEKYERITVGDPKKFVEGSFRTVDIGPPGYSKIIRGQLKTTGEWKTVTYLISREIREETKNKLRQAAVKELIKSSTGPNPPLHSR